MKVGFVPERGWKRRRSDHPVPWPVRDFAIGRSITAAIKVRRERRWTLFAH
jgi:hypothetical protein